MKDPYSDLLKHHSWLVWGGEDNEQAKKQPDFAKKTMGFHVSELTHENLLNYLYFQSHKWNGRLQGAAACCCMHEADVCIGRMIDGPDLASFSFLKQKCSPIEFLFISSSIDRGWAISSSQLPFCAEGKERWAYFPFPWVCSLPTMTFSVSGKQHTSKSWKLPYLKRKSQHTAKS